jgi:hypothetical protein
VIIESDVYSEHFYELLVTDKRYVIAFGSRGCFGKKQLVQTDNGLKKISKVQVGDMVKSANPLTGDVEFKPVINVFKYENNEKCIKINYDNQIIICTLDHKFYYQGEFVEIAKILKDNGININ